jgi:phage replication-related protein YjqB (UPF0714/DUF867 family)
MRRVAVGNCRRATWRGIEPGTSEVAHTAAAEALGFYAFEGLKPRGNGNLHITSTRCDEPVSMSLIERSQVVLAIHGEHGQADGPSVFAGGLHQPLRRRIETALRARGFDVRHHTDPDLQGSTHTTCATAGRRAGEFN